MAKSNGEKKTRWDAFSDYQQVSKRVAKSVDDAVDSYAALQAAQSEGANLPAEEWAKHKANILAAATRLVIEMEREREVNEQYEEILNRWKGTEETSGDLEKLQQTRVTNGVPGWLYQMIVDIRRAAWELGYLQSGREEKPEPDDEVEREVENMFSDL
jgi:hypothetical protein